MENGWNLVVFNNSNNCGSGGRGQNGNCANVAWDIWELGNSTSRYDDWSNHNSFDQVTATAAAAADTTTATSSTKLPEASEVHALMFPQQGSDGPHQSSSSRAALYSGVGSHFKPDPHLMCLKLGKRHYFEDAIPPAGGRHVDAAFAISKRFKPYYSTGGASTSGAVTVAAQPTLVPKCQVEGCHVGLLNAKDYHRRHKVCEMHSKAPKVVVLGLEQRFCQQCSRFHAVSEFDESKRSCRRRLAGHNERRRKSSINGHSHSLTRNSLLLQENKLMAGRFAHESPTTGRAFSLLSSNNESCWFSSPDLSSKCSAALHELIAENRAAILGRDWHWNHHTFDNYFNGQENNSHPDLVSNQHQILYNPNIFDRLNEADTTMTLNLMQAPSSAYGFLSTRGKSKEAEDCSDFWSSLGGTHVV